MLKILSDESIRSIQANAQQQQQLAELTTTLRRILVRGFPPSKDKEQDIKRPFSSLNGRT